MEIKITDKQCWGCDGSEKITLHHALPQHIKPKKNIIIPLCEKCHNKVNAGDISGMYAYAYKLEKLSEQTIGHAKVLRNLVERMVEEKIK